MSFILVVPARFGSSRLPGKPLLDIAGRTMIRRVCEQAGRTGADRVLVATDDRRIQEEVESWGGSVVMTSADHPSGTDRLAEVVSKLELADDQVVVNLQGDEPLMPPEVVDQVAENLLQNTQCVAATLCEPIASTADFRNPSVVKVVADLNSHALYFSRAPIPWPRDEEPGEGTLPSNLNANRHLGIYAYRAGLLRDFVSWPVAELERTEMLEQLRILAQGGRIHLDRACAPVPAGIDTAADLERVRELFAQ